MRPHIELTAIISLLLLLPGYLLEVSSSSSTASGNGGNGPTTSTSTINGRMAPQEDDGLNFGTTGDRRGAYMRRESANLGQHIEALHDDEDQGQHRRDESKEAPPAAAAATTAQLKPPRAYCARISRAIPYRSPCFRHLVLPNKIEQNNLAPGSRRDEDGRMVPSGVGRDEPGLKATRHHHQAEELVYVRLETIGAKITDLSTQAINERLVKQLFEKLFSASSSSSPSSSSSVTHQNNLTEPKFVDSKENKNNKKKKRNDNKRITLQNVFEDELELELGQIRTQILDLPPGVDGSRQQVNCREAIEKAICRFVYPSCHFRRVDVSALVRPPCREDCLVLRDLFCPNVNMTKLFQVVRQTLNSTLMSALNTLDLAVEGDREALAAMIAAQAATSGRSRGPPLAEPKPLDNAGQSSLDRPNSQGLLERSNNNNDAPPHTDGGQIKRGAIVLAEEEKQSITQNITKTSLHLGSTLVGKQNLQTTTNKEPLSQPKAPGNKPIQPQQQPQLQLQRINFASIHFYWPHERALGECYSLPPLRPLTPKLLVDAVNARKAPGLHNKSNISLASSINNNNNNKNNNNNTNTNTNRTMAPIQYDTHNDIATTVTRGKSPWANESILWRWRQRARNKWPICSNAHLTETIELYLLEQYLDARPRPENQNETSTIATATTSINESELQSSPHRNAIRADCLGTDTGFDYMGRSNKTKSGLGCQSWQAQWPHEHSSSELLFDNMKDAHNYCRNPGGLKEKPWCYTVDSGVKWQYCYIDPCVDHDDRMLRL